MVHRTGLGTTARNLQGRKSHAARYGLPQDRRASFGCVWMSLGESFWPWIERRWRAGGAPDRVHAPRAPGAVRNLTRKRRSRRTIQRQATHPPSPERLSRVPPMEGREMESLRMANFPHPHADKLRKLVPGRAKAAFAFGNAEDGFDIENACPYACI